MNREIEKIANAVLYEGYMLYPYRPSAVKNQQRWNFGVIYPQAHGQTISGADACLQRTECVLQGSESSTVEVRVRFLQAISRQVGKPRTVRDEGSRLEPDVEIVGSLEVDDRVLRPWQEAVERDATLPAMRLCDLLRERARHRFAFDRMRDFEPIGSSSGRVGAYFVRTREAIEGCVEVSCEACAEGIFRLTVLTFNLTPLETPEISREEVLLRSFLSAHTLLHVEHGEFASLMDPPAKLQATAAGCRNTGTWPVMIGSETARNEMLSSPIILYDYPQVAPESPGDLFDNTEIDEILALRILTLSDEEKREILQSDRRASEILQRTEAMPMEHFMKLHGVLRGMTRAGRPQEDTQSDGAK